MAAPGVILHNKGGGGGASATVTVDLGSPADAGNSLVIAYTAQSSVSSGPAGFTLDLNVSPGSVPTYWWRMERTTGGEQTFDVTQLAAGIGAVWGIWETDPLDTVAPLDEFASTAPFHPTTGTTTLTTGTTAGATGTTDTLCLALHAFYISVAGAWSGTFASWSGQTGGFTEDEESFYTFGAANTVTMDAAYSSLQATGAAGPFSSTATFSTNETRSATADYFTASVVSYRAGVTVDVPLGVLTVGGGAPS
jgi:hypothetical protein